MTLYDEQGKKYSAERYLHGINTETTMHKWHKHEITINNIEAELFYCGADVKNENLRKYRYLYWKNKWYRISWGGPQNTLMPYVLFTKRKTSNKK